MRTFQKKTCRLIPAVVYVGDQFFSIRGGGGTLKSLLELHTLSRRVPHDHRVTSRGRQPKKYEDATENRVSAPAVTCCVL